MFNVWFEGRMLPKFADMFDGIAHKTGAELDAENRMDSLPQAHAAVAGGLKYNAELLDRAPDLLVVSRLGIGVDGVDIPACTERTIAVCNAPDGPTISTAEQAITLMMGVARNIKQIEHELRNHPKPGYYGRYIGIELYEKTLGVVGFGRIARHVARVAGKGLGMNVITYDPFVDASFAESLGVSMASSLEELLAHADVVSVHVPYMPGTHKMMNAERFAQMKPGAIFVNTARGGLVDEDALLEALDSGHLFGAGLDVSDPEPPLPDNPLLDRLNVILTPHVASATYDGKHRIQEDTLKQIIQVLQGERPTNLLNPEVWEGVLAKRQAILER